MAVLEMSMSSLAMQWIVIHDCGCNSIDKGGTGDAFDVGKGDGGGKQLGAKGIGGGRPFAVRSTRPSTNWMAKVASSYVVDVCS
jgi:hypothetical protein